MCCKDERQASEGLRAEAVSLKEQHASALDEERKVSTEVGEKLKQVEQVTCSLFLYNKGYWVIARLFGAL